MKLCESAQTQKGPYETIHLIPVHVPVAFVVFNGGHKNLSMSQFIRRGFFYEPLHAIASRENLIE